MAEQRKAGEAGEGGTAVEDANTGERSRNASGAAVPSGEHALQTGWSFW